MNAPAPHIVPLFATPFGVMTVADGAALNPLVAALFSERATAQRADPGNRQAFAYRSRDDLLDWPDEPVRRLTAGIAGAAAAVIRSINDFSDPQFAAFRPQARAWFSIVHRDGCLPSISYQNAAWCAIYCLAAPQPTQQRFDSGVLRLHESHRPTMFSDATTALMRLPYAPGHSAWLPVPGQVAVFPAAVTHEIALLRGSGDLVLITTLLRFLAAEQTEIPWW